MALAQGVVRALHLSMVARVLPRLVRRAGCSPSIVAGVVSIVTTAVVLIIHLVVV